MGTSYSYNIYIDNKSLFGSADKDGNRIVGFNKRLRDSSRICLFINSMCLLFGLTFFASISAVVAIFILSQGTMASTRNLRWGLTAYVSMAFSFFAHFCSWAARNFDEEKAYTIKMLFHILGRGLGFMWGTTLCVFLFIAITNSENNNNNVPIAAVATASTTNDRVIECHAVETVDRTWRSSEPVAQSKSHAKKTS